MFDNDYAPESPRVKCIFVVNGLFTFETKCRRRRHAGPESLSENCEGSCGEGFWFVPSRRGSVPDWPWSIPGAGCQDRANAGRRQKARRPAGFRGKGRLASLHLSRRSTRDILLRRALPSSLPPENRTPRNFQTGSYCFTMAFQRCCISAGDTFSISCWNIHWCPNGSWMTALRCP